MFSLCHISLSPVCKSGRRSGMSSSTGSCGNTPSWRRIALWCLFLRPFRYWDEVTAVPTNLSCGCFNNVGSWSCSWLNDSSCTLFVFGVYPHWVLIRKGSQVFDSVSSVIGERLLLLPLLVLLSKPSQMRPLWCKCLLWLRNVCFQTSAHQKFSWAQIAPGQWGCSVAEDCHVRVASFVQ